MIEIYLCANAEIGSELTLSSEASQLTGT